MREEHPNAEFLIHPECGCATQAMEYVAAGDIDPDGVHMLSTGGMLGHVEEHPDGEYIVATENGMLHPLQQAAPKAKLVEANRMAFCKYMKMITLPKVRDSLRDIKYEVKVPPEIAERASCRSSAWSRSASAAGSSAFSTETGLIGGDGEEGTICTARPGGGPGASRTGGAGASSVLEVQAAPDTSSSSVARGTGDVAASPRIVGGSTTTVADFPWQAAVVLDDGLRRQRLRGPICGGTFSRRGSCRPRRTAYSTPTPTAIPTGKRHQRSL